MSKKININYLIAGFLIVVAAFLTFTYRFPVALNFSDKLTFRDFYAESNLQIFAEDKITQDRSSQGRYDREFLTNISIPYVQVDGASNILFRPIPNKVRFQNQDYFYTLFNDQMVLGKDLSNFQDKVPVVFYENNTRYTINSTFIDFLKGMFGNNYHQEKNCPQMNDVSACERLDFRSMKLDYSKDSEKLKVSLTVDKSSTDSKISVFNGIKLMQKWSLCDSKNSCLRRDEPYQIEKEEDFPIQFLKEDGTIERVEKLENVALTPQDTYNLKLPDDMSIKKYYQPIITFEVNKEIQDYYEISYPGGAKVRVYPDKSMINNVFVDQRFDLLMFESKDCGNSECRLDFEVEVL
jgi:hypothetical protein